MTKEVQYNYNDKEEWRKIINIVIDYLLLANLDDYLFSTILDFFTNRGQEAQFFKLIESYILTGRL